MSDASSHIYFIFYDITKISYLSIKMFVIPKLFW